VGDDEMDYNPQDDYLDQDDIPDYQLRTRNRSRDEQFVEIPYSDATSFYDTLKQQVSEQDLSDEQKMLVEYLIGSLSSDGFLSRPLADIQNDLAIYNDTDVSMTQLEEALQVLQTFDPAGIGARDLQECLLLQIRRHKQAAGNDRLCDLEELVVEKHFDDFKNRNWGRIRQQTGMSEEEYAKVFDELTHLNPRPGAAMGENMDKNFQHIVPDFIVETDDNGNISLQLNDRNVPALRIEPGYARQMEKLTKGKDKLTKADKEAVAFYKEKINAAQNFISNVRQRKETLLKTMWAIIHFQRPYFLEGDESLLKPMTLKDVANLTGLEISTISRVNNSKYVQTNFGIFPLKHFFGDKVVNDEGEEIATREIKHILQEMIQQEDKANPYSDQQLTELMNQKGYPLKRRTITKYRQQLNIPVARLRK